MIFIAASMSLAFRSGIFCSAISRSWSLLSEATLVLWGSPEPLATPAAFLISSAAGGVFVMKASELIVRGEAAALLAAFTTELEALPWVSNVTVEENRVRVSAADAETAQSALLPLIVKHNLPLLRYEWVRPNLEDIFLTLSEEAKP